jgi:hypothetical protein
LSSWIFKECILEAKCISFDPRSSKIYIIQELAPIKKSTTIKLRLIKISIRIKKLPY